MHVLFVMGRCSCDCYPMIFSLQKEKSESPWFTQSRPGRTGGTGKVPGHGKSKGKQRTRPGEDGHLEMSERIHLSYGLFLFYFVFWMFLNFLFISCVQTCCLHVYICTICMQYTERQIPKLETQTIVSYHVATRNQTRVLRKRSLSSEPLSHLCSPQTRI